MSDLLNHRAMISRRACLLAAAAAAALPQLATAQNVGQGTLRLGTATEPNSFDPHFAYFGPNRQAHMPVYEPLVMYGPKLELQPSLAVSWKAVTPTRWEIDLRPGVLFHDGSPLVAEDVVFSLARAPAVPDSPSTLGVYTQSIRQVAIIHPLKIAIDTHGPAPLLMGDLANIPIVSRHVGSTATAVFDAGTGITGTGPYKFVTWVKGDHIEYAAHTAHWGGKPGWDRVVARYIPDARQRMNALLSGDCQLVDQVPPEQITSLRNNPAVRLSEVASNFLLFLHLDQFRETSPFITDKQGRPIKNPLLDVRVRQAISMAVNRERLTADVLLGAAAPALQLMPKSFDGTLVERESPPFNPSQARQMLAAAGYPDGFRMTLHGTSGRYTSDVDVLARIAEDLTRVGIDAQAVSLPSAAFFTRATSGDKGLPEFSAIQVGWASVEPSSALKGLLATFKKSTGFGSSNRGRFSDPVVDRQLAQALGTIDPQARASLVRSATRRALVDDQGLVPLYFPVNVWASTRPVTYEARVDSSTFPMNAMTG